MDNDDSKTPPHSYFYPVKSLLSGHIGPELSPNTTSGEPQSDEPLIGTGIVHLPPVDPQNVAVSTRSAPQPSQVQPNRREDLAPKTVLQTEPVEVRFEHAQDAHGNHFVVVPKGQIRRCEDEVEYIPPLISNFLNYFSRYAHLVPFKHSAS
jgi:hypothetical protein